MMRVALKYCGSCNPYIDLPGLARHIEDNSRELGYQLVSSTETDIDILVILCGCPRACGDKPEARALASQHIVVAGESVGGIPTPEGKLREAVENELAVKKYSLSLE